MRPALGLSCFRWSAVGTCLGNSGRGWILFLSRSNCLNDWWKICRGRRLGRVLGCFRLRIVFTDRSCRTLSFWTGSCSTCLFGSGFRSLCTGLDPVAEMMGKLHFYLFTKGLHTCSWWSSLFWTWKTRHICLGRGWWGQNFRREKASWEIHQNCSLFSGFYCYGRDWDWSYSSRVLALANS